MSLPPEPLSLPFATPADALRKVAVTSTHHKPEAHGLAASLRDRLAALGAEVVFDPEGRLPLAEAVPDADLVVAVGGDGTLLGTARRLVGSRVPVLGVNLGKLGFLVEHAPQEVLAYLGGAPPDGWRLSPKMMLQATLDGHGTGYALNEVSVSQSDVTRLLAVSMAVDGREATQYRGDGVVVSTPVGSTGYSLSLGGPILSQGLRAFVVTPMAPHTLTDRAIVIEGSSALSFSVQTRAPGLWLVFDGQERIPLPPLTPFVVRAAPTDLLLVTSGRRAYFDVLRHKLRWGEPPNLREP